MPVIEYRATLGARTQHKYWLRPPEDSPLRQQWRDLMTYKTAVVPTLERSAKGKWRVSPLPLERNTACNWFKFHEGNEVPSAGAAWSKVGAFLGWLCLPTGEGGMGIRHEQLQTLAWLILISDDAQQHECRAPAASA
jgi:hypothetical protein